MHPSTQPPQHSYGTRIRHNISIKPSARRRNSPDPAPRSLKPTLHPKHTANNINLSPFPPPHILLHPEDANNKVFLAIARSFLSVDNRAMTIKDLAEMTVNFGLVCQNVSAASQAITTYIRTHLHRCDVEQDHPLLLKHVLSGTASDDDLLPALFSRSGGAHCTTNVETRLTNFRRGTVIWYLSRATGAPCPFARAGIRICDYTEDGKVGHSGDKKKRRERDRGVEQSENCGQKRKRPLRSHAGKGDSDSDHPPPPKVKLTLRLKPLLTKTPASPSCSGSRLSKDYASDTSSDYSMSDKDSSDDESHTQETRDEEEPWSLPPYPRRSITIPLYTPCSEGPYPSYFPSPSLNTFKDPFRRAHSIPSSEGSPPPDSDDDGADFHVLMTHSNLSPNDDLDWSPYPDSDEDDTLGESPGPRSPSAPLINPMPEIAVKEEPQDVQGMLAAWDDFDTTSGLDREKVTKAAEALVHAAHVMETEALRQVKVESSDMWDWNYTSQWPNSPLDDNMCIKEEELDIDSLFPTTYAGPSGLGLSSPPSEGPSSDLESDMLDRSSPFATIRPRAKTAPALYPFDFLGTPQTVSSFSLPPLSTSRLGTPECAAPSPLSTTQALASLIQSVSSPTSTTFPPSFSLLSRLSDPEAPPTPPPPKEVVVVRTCQPCAPAISATQIEGISVYQMALGPHMVLRRIDTDFVNLSPIVAYSGAPPPVLNTIPNVVVIQQGSHLVTGIWAPLSAAQAYIKAHPQIGGLLDVFLSDTLYERFPPALQDFHRDAPARMLNQLGRLLNQFGPHFASTLRENQKAAKQKATIWDHRNVALSAAVGKGQDLEEDTPLSATEQEIFHELCVVSEWEKDEDLPEGNEEKVLPLEAVPASPPELTSASPLEQPAPPEVRDVKLPVDTQAPPQPHVICTSAAESTSERPLRRSKRVAELAVQTQSRARSRRGGSRNTLS